MKEEIFTATRKRILSQTFALWLWLISHLIINIWFAPIAINDGKLFPLLLGNIFFSLISIPGVIIFIRYYKHSVNKQFIITYNTLKFLDLKTGSVSEIKNHEITNIKLVTNHRSNKLPWNFFEYFSLTDKNGKQIIVTSFFMDISEFWLSTLTRKVSGKNFTKDEVTFPFFIPPA